ncbi:hypothetical protein NP493_193g02032 [Ridgeia piscesae]|uniref:Cilia- and flagella-associated protein 45 n=1 Tax=Ridgeia piscesae TaxID=27915 RepID=A0AAD9UET6_RIDPI|nr:hypothetical protein NP493_193g02032 [Ridgeia piscesae]
MFSQPGSAVSFGGSQTSSGSRRARTRQYHTVATTSQVDESLFGNSAKKQAPGGDPLTIERQAEARISKRKSSSGPKREVVQLVTKDLIRNLIIPHEDPSGDSVVLRRGEFERIRQQARVITAEERKAAEDAQKQAKEQAVDQLHERKNYMKEKDMERKQNEQLNDLEEEEREKSDHLRAKAIFMLQEQEDEIKHLNELILNAKCQAIRDAQLLEKDQITRELTDEEKRLDDMMEIDRVNAIRMEEEIQHKIRQERLIGAKKIMDQIAENEQDRLLLLERKDQENRLMQKYLDKLCAEDMEKLQRRRAEQNRLYEELNSCNSDLLFRKEYQKEQERVLDQKVLAYQKAKAEREMAFEKEQERIRIEKEKETARLRALQERQRDEQAERDALRAKRAQEEAERQWRRKEAEEAKKKAETVEMLKNARSKQQMQKEHFLSVQAQRERSDFERVLRAQQELVVKEQREDQDRKKKNLAYADDVRGQIREKEQVRIADRNAFFHEGVKMEDEARKRRMKLDEVKAKKLDELRSVGINEKYLSQVERKVNKPDSLMV